MRCGRLRLCALLGCWAACGSGNDAGRAADAAPPGDMRAPSEAAAVGTSPTVGGCRLFPANHVFNTPIEDQPVHARSAAFLATIGSHRFHLDLGTATDPASAEYYGIPYNVVPGDAITWVAARFRSADPDLSWDPRVESDCAEGNAHTLVSPCTAAAAPNPIFPIPALPLVEGGIDRDPAQPYGDHHILLLDTDRCRLWELYHAYPGAAGGWDIFGSATFDLRSNALRKADWSSADAAGFPILPLLLRADEASAGTIRHALRFTIQSKKIRIAYVWPARHLTGNGTMSDDLPPMGQLFRLKASYAIPAGFNTQARAILQAMKTYGLYIADGGSDMYVTGEPSASWQEATFSQVQSVSNAELEAVDLSALARRPGFDPDSAAVP